MNAEDLRALQAPLKNRYRAEPDAARITLRAKGSLEEAGVEFDTRGNVKANTLDYRSSAPKVFACGDMRRGQSLVVWAIREGRQCARAVDEFLTGSSLLPR